MLFRGIGWYYIIDFINIICDLLRENRPSGVVCQNVVTYCAGCMSIGRSHRKKIEHDHPLGCGVIVTTMIDS